MTYGKNSFEELKKLTKRFVTEKDGIISLADSRKMIAENMGIVDIYASKRVLQNMTAIGLLRPLAEKEGFEVTEYGRKSVELV